MRMTRKSLNLLVDEDLIKKARNHGLVISRFLENKLVEYFSFIDAVSRTSTPNIGEQNYLKSVNENNTNNRDTHNSNSLSMDWTGSTPVSRRDF